MLAFDFLLVYMFSKTPFFGIYLIMVILGVFGGANNNQVNFCLLLITFHITSLSVTISILCHIKTFYNWALSLFLVPCSLFLVPCSLFLVPCSLFGVIFLEKYVPKKGITNLLILHLPIILFVIIEILSLKYQISQKLEQCDAIFEAGQSLIRSGHPERAKEMFRKLPEMYESINSYHGFMTLMANHPFLLKIRDILSKISDL